MKQPCTYVSGRIDLSATELTSVDGAGAALSAMGRRASKQATETAIRTIEHGPSPKGQMGKERKEQIARDVGDAVQRGAERDQAERGRASTPEPWNPFNGG